MTRTGLALAAIRRYDMGPPNDEVLREWRGEKVETFLEANERLRARMFPGGYEPLRRALYESLDDYGKTVWARVAGPVPEEWGSVEVGIAAAAMMCESCGKKPMAAGKKKCWGCIKATQRAK